MWNRRYLSKPKQIREEKTLGKYWKRMLCFYWTYYVSNMPFGLKIFSIFLDRVYLDYQNVLPINYATFNEQAKMLDVILAK
jgi:hypothetical protein